MDAVYPLGNGSSWKNNELKYSLRSLHVNAHINKVFVFGSCRPDWLQNIVWVEVHDRFRRNKEANIWTKVLRACLMPEVSDPFLFMNDDHIILEGSKVGITLPYYFDGTLKDVVSRKLNESYSKCAEFTRIELKKSGVERPLNYDIHVPMLVGKNNFLGLTELVPWRVDKIGCSMLLKSTYCNLISNISGRRMKDPIVRVPVTGEDYDVVFKGVENFGFLSFNDHSLNGLMKSYLFHKFPNPSIFEEYDEN